MFLLKKSTSNSLQVQHPRPFWDKVSRWSSLEPWTCNGRWLWFFCLSHPSASITKIPQLSHENSTVGHQKRFWNQDSKFSANVVVFQKVWNTLGSSLKCLGRYLKAVCDLLARNLYFYNIFYSIIFLISSSWSGQAPLLDYIISKAKPTG